MMSSSPSPSATLHQYANTDSDQNQGPKTTEPIEMPPAELIEQEDYAQSDQDQCTDRHARTWTLHNRRCLAFDGNRRPHAIRCCRGRLACVPEQVHVVEAEWIRGRHTHLFRLRRTIGFDRHV